MKWFQKVFQDERGLKTEDWLWRFCNKNNIKPGEVVILSSDPRSDRGVRLLVFMYYSENELD